jgi:hypothetical protein
MLKTGDRLLWNARMYIKLHGVISLLIVIRTYESAVTPGRVQPCATSVVRCLAATPYWLIQAALTSPFVFFFVVHEGSDCSFPSVLKCVPNVESNEKWQGDYELVSLSFIHSLIFNFLATCICCFLSSTGWSKILCAPDDYNTIVRCTETFWWPCTFC